jgi:hypothetical protein
VLICIDDVDTFLTWKMSPHWASALTRTPQRWLQPSPICPRTTWPSLVGEVYWIIVIDGILLWSITAKRPHVCRVMSLFWLDLMSHSYWLAPCVNIMILLLCCLDCLLCSGILWSIGRNRHHSHAELSFSHSTDQILAAAAAGSTR